MKNNILEREKEMLIYFKAQDAAYKQSKYYQWIDLLSALIAIAPIPLSLVSLKSFSYDNIDLLEGLVVFGVVWTIVSVLTDPLRNHDTKIGATIQEKIDAFLFGFSENHILIDEFVNESTVVKLSAKSTRTDILPWYSSEITPDLPHKVAVLLCYKENTIWGLNQSSRLVNGMRAVLLLFYSTITFFSIIYNKGAYDIALWVAPTIPFFIFGMSAIRSRKRMIQSYNQIEKTIRILLNNYINDGVEPLDSQLRQIQDVLYLQRIVPNDVPGLFYKWWWKGISSESARNAIKLSKSEILKGTIQANSTT